MKCSDVAVIASLLFAVATVWPAAVVAEEAPEDEAGETEGDGVSEVSEVDDDEREPLEWDFRLTSEMHSSDNVGLRELDEDSGHQERIETDDRHTFSYTSASLGVDYEVLDGTRIVAAASHNGLWGSDQLGGTNEFDSFFFVYDLHIDWEAFDSDAVRINPRIGRQHYSIGGTHRDFFFSDLVDGLVLAVEDRLEYLGEVALQRGGQNVLLEFLGDDEFVFLFDLNDFVDVPADRTPEDIVDIRCCHLGHVRSPWLGNMFHRIHRGTVSSSHS